MDEFTAAVRRVADGRTAIDMAIADELRAGVQNERERTVLDLADGAGSQAETSCSPSRSTGST